MGWAAREGLGYRDETPSGFNIGLENARPLELVLPMRSIRSAQRARCGDIRRLYALPRLVVIGLPPASMAYLLGPNPEAQARLGQWTGMMYSAAGIFALTGPLIAGHLISAYGNNFLTVQLWSGACMMLSA